MRVKTLAVPIRAHDFSDSSQVVALFTQEAGLVEAIAKGAYRQRNAFEGPFDLAVLREVVYAERRPPALAIVTESEVLDGWRGIRTSWTRHVAASHLLEFLRLVATGGEPPGVLFELAVEAFEALDSVSEESLSGHLLRFELGALRALGFLGAVDACVHCGRPWPGGSRSAYFSPRDGGLVCRRCYGRSSRPVATLPGEEVGVLQGLAGGSGAAPLPERGRLARLHGLLFESTAWFLERPLRMLQYSRTWLGPAGTADGPKTSATAAGGA